MKWTAGLVLVEAAAAVAVRLLAGARRPGTRRDWATWLVAFVLVPGALYLAAYLPFFLHGNGLGALVSWQRDMWRYHLALAAHHAYESRWYGWPWLIRPVWFYENDAANGLHAAIYAMGNPLVFWPLVPAVAWVGYRFYRLRATGDAFIVVAFLGLWLPFAAVQRLTFLQHFLPALPFGVLAVATVLDDLAGARRARWLVVAHLAGCVAALVYFYPVWTGLFIAGRR